MAVFSITDMHSIRFGWEFNYAYFSMSSTATLLYSAVIQVNITKTHYLNCNDSALNYSEYQHVLIIHINYFFWHCIILLKYTLPVVTKVAIMRFGWITQEVKKKFMKCHSWCQTTFQFLTMLACSGKQGAGLVSKLNWPLKAKHLLRVMRSSGKRIKAADPLPHGTTRCSCNHLLLLTLISLPSTLFRKSQTAQRFPLRLVNYYSTI